MPTTTAISLRDIAKAANVSAMTVSLALRDGGSISEPTRVRIKQLAEDMGYRRHPLRALLGREARIRKTNQPHSTLAWLYATPRREDLFGDARFRLHWTGAQKRAAELGFSLDAIWLGQTGLGQRRLREILSYRGISGLVLHCLKESNPLAAALPYDSFPTVSIGPWAIGETVTEVLCDAGANTRTALLRLQDHGFKRIGFANGSSTAPSTREEAAAACFYHAHKLTGSPPVAPFDGSDTRCGRARSAALKQWIEAHRLEAILTDCDEIPRLLAQADFEGHSRPTIVHLALSEGTTIHPGIDAKPALLGATAINQIANVLVRNDPLDSQTRTSLRIRGEWTNGELSARGGNLVADEPVIFRCG